MSLALSAVPASPVTAEAGDGASCSPTSRTLAVGDDVTPAVAIPAVSVGASLPAGDAPCPPGPCPTMPLTTCTGGGCASTAPVPSTASADRPSAVRAVVPAGAPTPLLSPASRQPTPPPRG